MTQTVFSSSFFQKLALAGLGAMVFLPFLSMPPWFSPPAWGQTIMFRVVMTLLLLALLAHFALQKRALPIKLDLSRPVFLQLALFSALFLFFLASTLFSLDPYFSFWGIPERAWGFLNLMFYAAFALTAFLFLAEKQWRLLWKLAIGGAALVALVALAQQLGIPLSDTFVTVQARPTGTVGSAIILALYLLPFNFFALGLGIKTQGKKKYIWLAAFALFSLVTFLTLTRAAILAFGAALLLFFFLYPQRSAFFRKVALFILGAGILSLILVNTAQPPSLVAENELIRTAWYRASLENIAQEPRVAAWQTLLPAVLEQPFLGHGLYSSSVAFDTYYHPGIVSATGWWDTAHNLFLDIALWAGIPGLLAFLLFLGTLFWQLSQVKKRVPELALKAHRTQIALVAYLLGAFFAFDAFATYLVFFLLLAYSWRLISKLPGRSLLPAKTFSFTLPPRVFSLGLILAAPLSLWFLWSFHVQPLHANKEMNWAVFYAKEGACDKALSKMNNAVALAPSHFAYSVNAQSTDVIAQCIQKVPPQRAHELSQQARDMLLANAKTRPFFTRNWLLLGGYTNNLIATAPDQETKKELALNAEQAFQKSLALSPQREEVYWEWIRTYKLLGDYQSAAAKADECLSLNPESGACWWEKAVAEVQLDNFKAAQESLAAAKENRYIDQEEQFLFFVSVYDRLRKQEEKTEYYQELAWAYERLAAASPENFQYHASLSFVYAQLGEYEKAKATARDVMRLNPAATESVEEFLKTLPQ